MNRIKMAGNRAALGAVDAERSKLRQRALKSRAVENQKRVKTSRSMKKEHAAKVGGSGNQSRKQDDGNGNVQSSPTTTSNRKTPSSTSINDGDLFNSLESRLDVMLDESQGMKTLAARLRARAQGNLSVEKKEAKRKRREALKLSKVDQTQDQSGERLDILATDPIDDDGSGIRISTSSDSISETWGQDSLKPTSESGFIPVEEFKRDSPAHLSGVYAYASRSPTPTPNLPPSFSRRNPSSIRDRGTRSTRLIYGEEAISMKKVLEPSTLTDHFDEDVSKLDSDQLEAREKAKVWSERRHGKISGLNVSVEKVQPLREMKVPPLAHGLDRVLFNPGVYWLRDPRSGIYNFDPHLRKVLDVDLFDYTALPPYITSSKDEELVELTRRHQRKFCGSTSSM